MLHEAIRIHAQAAGKRVKEEGLDNDLINKDTSMIHYLIFDQTELDQIMDVHKFVGRAPEQTVGVY